jgi:hypothetical protein
MPIQLIEPDQASDQVRRIYDSLAQRLGSVSNFYKMLAHKPEILRAFSQLYAALMVGAPCLLLAIYGHPRAPGLSRATSSTSGDTSISCCIPPRYSVLTRL